MFYILRILLVTWTANVVQGTTNRSVFFHEPSAIPLKTKDGNMDFGFSMGFQRGKNTLVISAPIESNTMHLSHHTIGKVYTCPVSDLNNITCGRANIDVELLAKYNLKGINPNQNFLLGASIATTPDYFLTCAPLWTSSIASSRFPLRFSFGTCFIYNGTAHRYLGYPELFVMNRLDHIAIETRKQGKKDEELSNTLQGGIGWNTLVDEENHLILIAKLYSGGHLFYLNTKEPLQSVSHLSFKEYKDIQNLGSGMAAGKFFGTETSYAISVQQYEMTGIIYFLEKRPTNKNLLKIKCLEEKRNCKSFKIFNVDDVGSMFGYTMAAADVNGDGFTELIVGAPAQRDETPEYGAVYIYMGGSMVYSPKKKRVLTNKKLILGDVENGRFGMAIATSDIDGDNIPEIIVSAPYEDAGKGAVYIISGYKINKALLETPTMQVQVSKLEPQKIQKSDFRLFGYSLQVVEDLDANGCNELAIGSPGSSRVLLFRSLQAVRVKVDLSTKRQIISDIEFKFDVKVCINMEFNKKATYINGKILVNNFAYGNGVKLDNPQFVVDLSEIHKKNESQYCNNVPVSLKKSDVGVYIFNTEIEMSSLQESLTEKDISKTVAVFSPQSETKQSIEIKRRCDGDDCQPKLSMDVLWSGGPEYLLGSSENETLTVTVRNDGFNANGGCVHVVVKGAQVRRTNTDCIDTGKYYRCRLRNPLRRNTSEIIAVELDMRTKITNLNKSLEIMVTLFEDCNNVTLSNELTKLIWVDYKLDTNSIHITSENHNLDITEKSLSDEAAKTLRVDQVYLIHNTGKFRCLDLDTVITFNNTEFDFSVEEIVGIRNCSKLNEKMYKLKCKVDLEPDYVTKVILGIEMKKESIGQYITSVKETKIKSIMSLSLTEVTASLISRSESIVTYNKDTSVGNNKFLLIFIGVLVALLLLGGLCFILYKYGFFQGQNKKKLDRAKATVRQRSIKKSTTSQDTQRLHDDRSSPCDMEIVEDNAFAEPSRVSTKDSHKLIEEKAEVHNEEKH